MNIWIYISIFGPIWFFMSLITYAGIVYIIALDAESTFTETLFTIKDHTEYELFIIFSVIFPIGIIAILIDAIEMKRISFNPFDVILRKIFYKKHIRERVIKEI